jgi:flavin-dependent dehydrogenase
VRPDESCDVVVVGAGPAGAAAAAFFAREGFAARLVDRSTFPRFKPCGDFLSPEANRILRRLGVEEAVRKAGARRLRGLLVSAHGEPSLRADFEPGVNVTGYALERARLDAILLDAARRAGAEVHEGATVEGLAGGAAVRVRFPTGELATWRARLVVGAGGKRCPIARDLAVQRRWAGDGRIDLLAHWDGLDVDRPYCEMHVFGPGYTGMAPSAPDRVNVNTVVPTSWLRAHAADGNGGSPVPNGDRSDPARGNGQSLRERLYERLIRATPAVRRALEGGRRLYAPVASDITPLSTTRATGDGVLLAGDAALFIDPFTGQGIYLALRSAEMAFEVGARALAGGDTSAGRLSAYDDRRRAEFVPKVRLSRLLQAIVYRPRLARDVAATLRRDRKTAQLLIGVIGDYRPAGDLLRPRLLTRVATSRFF